MPIDPSKVAEFLDAIHEYQRVRRRDGARYWGIFYDAEIPGVYVENYIVESWAEHMRQHNRFTLADRKFEERVHSFTLEPSKSRHFLYAEKITPDTSQ